MRSAAFSAPTDGGASFEKVLYKDEYTSGNDVRIDPSHPNTVYAALWQQQQGFFENGAFGGTDGGIFKSTDGGSTWKKLAGGLPPIIQANLAIAPSNPKVIYAMVAAEAPDTARSGGRAEARRRAAGAAATFRSTRPPMAASTGGLPPKIHACFETGSTGRHPPDNRPLGRIGGGDLPTITVDPKNEKVVYSCSTVFWRTEDAGLTWSAVRGAPGGDDYQKSWINPDNPNIILLVSDQGGVVSANRGESWSNWYNQPTARDVSRDRRQRLPLSPLQRAAGFRIGLRRQPQHGRRNHFPRLASGGYRGVRRSRPGSEESGSGLRRESDGL